MNNRAFTPYTIIWAVVAADIICVVVYTGKLLGWYEQRPDMIAFVQFVVTSLMFLLAHLFTINRVRTSQIGYLQLKAGLRTGAAVSIIVALIVMAFMQAYFSLIHPTWRQEYLDVVQIPRMKLLQFSPARIEAEVKNYWAQSSFMQAAKFFFQTFMAGMMEAMVISLLLRMMVNETLREEKA